MTPTAKEVWARKLAETINLHAFVTVSGDVGYTSNLTSIILAALSNAPLTEECETLRKKWDDVETYMADRNAKLAAAETERDEAKKLIWFSRYHAAANKLAAAEQANAGLVGDRERLDWLAASLHGMKWDDTGLHRLMPHAPKYVEAPSFRGVIDAARSAEAKGDK